MILLCPICKLEFNSKRKKKYCSLNCYTKSDTFKECAKRLEKLNGKESKPRIKINCPQCGIEFETSGIKPKKYCTKICWRKHYAERFDRFIANPETIALPQAYDEYLSKNILHCLFENCNWTGRNLASHVNNVHGVSAREFKKMAGFNLKTALNTADISEGLRERAIENNLGEIGKKNLIHGLINPYRSLEAKEHFAKAKAENNPGKRLKQTFKDNENNLVIKNCNYCGKEYRIPVMKRNKYCSKECKELFTNSRFIKDRVHKMNCKQCTLEFKGTYIQLKRYRKGKNIFCSEDCYKAYQIVHR